MGGRARRIQRRRSREEVMALTTRWRNSGSVSDILAIGTTEGDEASAESHFLEPDLRTTRQIAIVRVAGYLP